MRCSTRRACWALSRSRCPTGETRWHARHSAPASPRTCGAAGHGQPRFGLTRDDRQTGRARALNAFALGGSFGLGSVLRCR